MLATDHHFIFFPAVLLSSVGPVIPTAYIFTTNISSFQYSYIPLCAVSCWLAVIAYVISSVLSIPTTVLLIGSTLA